MVTLKDLENKTQAGENLINQELGFMNHFQPGKYVIRAPYDGVIQTIWVFAGHNQFRWVETSPGVMETMTVEELHDRGFKPA